jgi:hypothetical protein
MSLGMPSTEQQCSEQECSEQDAPPLFLLRETAPEMGDCDWMKGLTGRTPLGEAAGTRVALARRRTKPPRKGLVDLKLNCQDSSATVTIPGLIPVDTNANLQG